MHNHAIVHCYTLRVSVIWAARLKSKYEIIYFWPTDQSRPKVKVPAKSPPKGKGAKHPRARDYAKKQPQVRKAEKSWLFCTIFDNSENWQVRKSEKGKDYGWLDFLSLPKMKLPNFLGFNSDKPKAARAEKEGEQVAISKQDPSWGKIFPRRPGSGGKEES